MPKIIAISICAFCVFAFAIINCTLAVFMYLHEMGMYLILMNLVLSLIGSVHVGLWVFKQYLKNL